MMMPLVFTLFTLGAAPTVTVERNIVYATVGGDKLMLDLARPNTPGPHPVLVGFHGGAWKYGNRSDLSKPVGDLLDFAGSGPRSMIEVMAEQGFAVASVSYRLAPKHQWPAQIVDAKTAVRFLRANADKFNLDADRIGAFGFSAGGHLAALLGTVESEPSMEGDLYSDHTSKVNCVVDFFGPTDMTLYTVTPGLEKAYMVPLFGDRYSRKPEAYKQASPLNHVSKAAAPFLIFHGTVDVVVPIIHSERLADKLTEAKVPNQLVTIRGKGHGWSGQTAIETRNQTMKFFSEHLKVAK